MKRISSLGLEGKGPRHFAYYSIGLEKYHNLDIGTKFTCSCNLNHFQNQFVCWCWEILLTLCLHKTDLSEHDGLTLKINKQQQRQLR